MVRPVQRALLALSLFLLALPLTLQKPGVPSGLKADEAAYYMMAQSLAFDGDLELTVTDIDRAFDEFPFRPIPNMIAMTDDGWQTAHYGKPYIYSLFAAHLRSILRRQRSDLYQHAVDGGHGLDGRPLSGSLHRSRTGGPLLGGVLPRQRRIRVRLLAAARSLQHGLGGRLSLLRSASPRSGGNLALDLGGALRSRSGSGGLQQASARSLGTRPTLGPPPGAEVAPISALVAGRGGVAGPGGRGGGGSDRAPDALPGGQAPGCRRVRARRDADRSPVRRAALPPMRTGPPGGRGVGSSACRPSSL